MSDKKLKKVQIEPKDLSDRKYFPGTPGHPFHIIDKIQSFLAPIPFLLFAVLIFAIVYLLSENYAKSFLLSVIFLLDWILLRFLPIFHLSFGPPTLTSLVLVMLRAPFMLLDFPIALFFQLFGTLLVIYGFYYEPQFPKVSRYNIALTKAGVHNQKLKIVHLSDLHMEFFTSRENRAVEQINTLSPDLILFTGDFFNLSYQNNPDTHKDIIKFFDRLKSKLGTYAVTGSPSVDQEQYMANLLPNLKINFLRDQIVELEINRNRIQLIGLECTHNPNRDVKRLSNMMKPLDRNPSKTKLLLYHSPDIAPHLQSMSIDLQLSGHTHGGQVQIPLLGPIYSGSLYGRVFSSGHYFVNNTTHLIISRGLGLEGEAAPRVRFFSPPEISCISLELIDHHVK